VPPGVHRLREGADRLLARFGAAAVEDKAAERMARVFKVITVVCAVATVVGFFVLGETDLDPLVTWIVELALAALAVLSGLRWRACARLDLDDRKLQTIQRVLGILRADIPRDAPVSLTVDLRPYDRGGHVVVKQGPSTKYRHAWLELTATLADGTIVTLGLTDRVKRKVKRRGAREQWRSDLDLGLRPARRYGPVSEAARRMRERPVPPPLRLVTLREGPGDPRQARRLWARLRTPVTPSVPAQLAGGDTLLAILRWAYGGLASPRRSA
jgi:hypothetical protein